MTVAGILASLTAAQAQPFRQRRDRPPYGQVPHYPQRRGTPDLYSTQAGSYGTITATTPNQYGNLGGPSTGGGSGSP